MIQECLNSHIVEIQCDFADLSAGLSDALASGSRKVLCLNRKNVSTAHLLNLLRCYTAFEAEVTFATKVEFNRTADGSVSVGLVLKDNSFTPYVGTGTGTDIAIYFESLINVSLATVAYKVVRVKNILYIYSYDPAGSFVDTVTAVSSDPTLVGTTITNLQTKTDEILDLWNNITHEQLCKLIKFAGIQSKFEKLSTSSGCGC